MDSVRIIIAGGVLDPEGGESSDRPGGVLRPQIYRLWFAFSYFTSFYSTLSTKETCFTSLYTVILRRLSWTEIYYHFFGRCPPPKPGVHFDRALATRLNILTPTRLQCMYSSTALFCVGLARRLLPVSLLLPACLPPQQDLITPTRRGASFSLSWEGPESYLDQMSRSGFRTNIREGPRVLPRYVGVQNSKADHSGSTPNGHSIYVRIQSGSPSGLIVRLPCRPVFFF